MLRAKNIKKILICTMLGVMGLTLCMSFSACKDKAEKQNGLEYSLSDSKAYYTVIDCDDIAEVVIPFTYKNLPVIEIADNAFQDKKRLQRVSIASNITSIGDRAFSGCDSLNMITLPYSVITIGNEVFSGCTNLQSIRLPNSVISIGKEIFSGCYRLETVALPSALKEIPERAFAGCENLRDLHLPNEIKNIGAWAFFNCRELRNIELPENVEKLEEGAFAESGIQHITLSESITSIEQKTFFNCSNLLRVDFNTNRINTIKESAFENCERLNYIDRNIKILDIERIEKRAFKNCHSLTNLEIGNYPSLAYIGEEAFYGCNGWVEIFIPRNVIEIGKYAFGELSNRPLIVYVADAEKPDGWDEDWLYKSTYTTVIWDYP